MTDSRRYLLLAGVVVVFAGVLAGCAPAGARPDLPQNQPGLDAGERRAAMTKWHQEHDKHL